MDKIFDFVDYIIKQDLISEILIGTSFQQIPMTIRMDKES